MRTIITEFGKKAAKTLPFNEDYRHINSLKYHQQIRDGITEKATSEGFITVVDLQSKLHTLSTVFEEMTEESIEEFARINDEFNKSMTSLSDDQREKIQLFETTEKKIDELILFFSQALKNPTTPWQAAMQDAFLKVTADQKSAEEFTKFCLSQATYLPSHYHVDDMHQRFPGSQSGRNSSGFAHFQPCEARSFLAASKKCGALASSAPIKNITEEANQQTLQTFLTMLFESQVTCVLALGASSNRLDYKTVREGERYSTLFDEAVNQFKLTDKTTGKASAIKFQQFGVEDQKPLNLSDNDLIQLIEIYQHYTQGTILVHCDAGVGRTGQVIATFRFIDHFQKNQELLSTTQALIDAIITDNVDENTAKTSVNALYEALTTVIIGIRQTRYSVETEAQFTATLTLTLQLLAIRQGYTTKRELDLMRNALGIAIREEVSTHLEDTEELVSNPGSPTRQPSGFVRKLKTATAAASHGFISLALAHNSSQSPSDGASPLDQRVFEPRPPKHLSNEAIFAHVRLFQPVATAASAAHSTKATVDDAESLVSLQDPNLLYTSAETTHEKASVVMASRNATGGNSLETANSDNATQGDESTRYSSCSV